MKYHLITYGCQMNTADSEEMAQPLAHRGLTATAVPDDADIIIMNTCTVRDQAEHRADSNLGRLRAWKAKDPNRILVVAGCAASRWGGTIQKKYPHIDLVSPATQIEQFPVVIERVLKERWNWAGETQVGFVGAASGPPGNPDGMESNGISGDAISSGQLAAPTSLFGTDQTAYVTIMRGCNYSCSYCIVPQVRGREVYRPMTQILDEIQTKATAGKSDVMLLGQTVNSYYDRPVSGGERVTDFADLLAAVQAIPDVTSIRFMSPHPRHMRPRVIEAMRNCSKVARHIHLPVQSGSSRLLAAMKRLYTRSEYESIVAQLREAMPEILITTDIIVGYPGETEGDFEETLSLIKSVQFNGLFAFKYSPRPGTTASDLTDDVSSTEKEERLQRVLELNRQVSTNVAAH